MTIGRFRLILGISTVVSLSTLGGCAQINGVSGAVWGKTKQIGQSAGQGIASFLRPSSKQNVVFEGGERAVEYADERDENGVGTGAFIAKSTHVNTEPVVIVTLGEGEGVGGENMADLPMATGIYDGLVPFSAPHAAVMVGAVHLRDTASKPDSLSAIKSAALRVAGLRPAYSALDNIARKDSIENAEQSDDVLAGGPPLPPKQQAQSEDVSYVNLNGGSSVYDWQICQDQVGTFVDFADDGSQIDPNFDACMRAQGYLPVKDAIAIFKEQAKL